MNAPSLTAFLSPHGHVGLAPAGDAAAPVLPEAVVRRLQRAFEAGSGPGLLQLVGAEAPAELPAALAFWRRFVRLFMSALCAHPELDARWETLELPPPEDELAGLVAAAPPMVGGEYLEVGVLGALWAELQAAARDAIRAAGDVPAWRATCEPAWRLVGRVCFHLAE